MLSRCLCVITAFLLLYALPAALGAQSKPSIGTVYTVNVAIKEDGELLAQPYFVVEAGKVASITLNAQTRGPLSLSFSAEKYIQGGVTRDDAVAVVMEVSAMRDGREKILADPSAAILLGKEATISSGGLEISIEVQKGDSELIGKMVSCGSVDSIAATGANGSCCTAACVDGTTLTCCNVLSCCSPQCGACCSPIEP